MPYKKIPPEKIRAWVERHFEYKTRKNGSELMINSPFEVDAGYNFQISVDGVCNCWKGNQWAGPPKANGKRNCSFVNFVKLYLGITYPAAIRAILGEESDPSQYLTKNKTIDEDETPDQEVQLPSGARSLQGASGLAASVVHKWLKKRGVTDHKIEKYDLHYKCTDCIWPYYEFGELVYWQLRSSVDKIFLFPDAPKSDYLYGYDFVDPASYIVLTEAIFDAMTLERQAMALGGVTLSKTQIRKIKLKGPTKGVILAFDYDQAGINGIINCGSALKQAGFKVCYALPPDCKDWNDYGQAHGFDKILDVFDKEIKLFEARSVLALRAIAQKLSKR